MSSELPASLPEEWLIWAGNPEVRDAWINQIEKDVEFRAAAIHGESADAWFPGLHAALQQHLEEHNGRLAHWLYRVDVPESWIGESSDSYRLSLIVLYRTLQKVILRMQHAGRL
jgi:hypothetical protein